MPAIDNQSESSRSAGIYGEIVGDNARSAYIEHLAHREIGCIPNGTQGVVASANVVDGR